MFLCFMHLSQKSLSSCKRHKKQENILFVASSNNPQNLGIQNKMAIGVIFRLGLSDTTVLVIYRDILKLSISRYFVINYRDTMPVLSVIKNPFVMQY